MRSAAAYRGCDVVDADGRHVGVVGDVWPLDGGGEPELALVHVGRRFRRWKLVPLDGRARLDGDVLHLPWTRVQVDDAPSAEDRRWGDPADVARAHWRDSAD